MPSTVPRPRALITGASSGIGRELARLAAADGHDTVLVARRADALAALADELARAHGGDHRVLAADLAEPEAPEAIAATLARDALAVDVLVNNAGVGSFGPFLEQPLARERALVQVDVLAPLALTRLLVPAMMARGRGCVLNVASTAAFQPGPLMSSYYAAKAFLLSHSEALHEELRGTGVTVTALCPGPVQTGFQAAAGLAASRLANVLGRGGAEHVARVGWSAMRAGRAVVVPGALNRVQTASMRFLPRALVRRLVRVVQERTKER